MAISGFPFPGDSLARAPLTLVRCDDCTLVQLGHTVDRAHLYADRYWYRSGVNPTMVAALRDVVRDAMGHTDLLPGDHVLDIGSNDGTLLRQYPEWATRIGFDPATNLFDEASAGGNIILCDYYPPAYACAFRAKIITSIAMFYDIDNPNAFVASVRRHLHPDGLWIVQLQDLDAMLAHDAFDNICHEHLCYYSIGSFARLVARHDLTIDAVRAVDINGGSLRLVVRHRSADEPAGPWDDEERSGRSRALADLAARLPTLRRETRGLLTTLKAAGARVYGYAASTKCNTLLQYYGIGPDLITAFAERSPQKWGRTTATGIPIVSEDEMRAARPDYLFVGAWQFLEAFRARERDLLATGTKMIVPLPELRVWGQTGEGALTGRTGDRHAGL